MARSTNKLINVTVTSPTGTEGTIVSVDEEKQTVKVRLTTGNYADYAYHFGGGDDGAKL